MAEGRGEKPEAPGYNRHWFIKKETALEYRCEICANVFKDPLQIVVCGHQFCRSCLPNDVKKCPVAACDKDVKPHQVFPDESARKKVLALQIKCPSKQCHWKGSLQDFIEKHKNECPLHLVNCSNEACNEAVPRDGLEKHLQDECQYREIDCQHCEDHITIANERVHCERDCLRIPVDCPNVCQNEIPREEVQHHVEEECENTLIDCTFKIVGCEDKIQRGTVREHEGDMVHEHLSQAAQAINNLEQEKQAMTEKIEQLQELNNNLTQDLRDLDEREETSVNRIDSELNEFKEQGIIRLDGVQQATEQNFESLTQVVQQNGKVQETLLRIQQYLANLRTIVIPEIQATCLSNQARNKKLAENQDKLQKMIVVVHNKFSSALSSLRQEMDSSIDGLREAHDMERTARLEHEAWTEDELSKLNGDIAENRRKFEEVETALTITQDEMDERFTEHCKQLQLDYDNLSDKITKEKQSRENDFVQLSEEISELNSSINTGVLIWRVNNIESALTNSAPTKAKPLYGKPFYSEVHGYVLQPKIFFNGARLNDQGYISIFIQILKGTFDPILKWPFAKRIRFTLIEQESEGFQRDVQKVLVPAADAEELRKPSDDANNGFGVYKFVSHEVLRAGRYIVDDAMFVQIEVLDVEENLHSETL